MIPENKLSSYSVPAAFKGTDRLPFNETTGYEVGPVAFQDSSLGLQYQPWRIRLVGDGVYVTSPNTPESLVFTKRCITHLSLAFDQNARYVVAYLLKGTELWLYWFDPVVQKFTHTWLESGVRDVYVTLPDKRDFQLADSDIGIFYTKDDLLCARWQIERYQNIQVLQTGIAGRLLRVGMNVHYRLQFIFQAQPYDTYSCTLELNCL